MKTRVLWVIALGGVGLGAGSAAEGSLIFTSAAAGNVDGVSVAAEAAFGELGSTGYWDGTLVLRNLSTVPSKAQLLTGVLFSILDQDPALRLGSATLAPGALLATSSSRTSSTAINLIADDDDRKGRWQFLSKAGSTIGTGGYAAEYGLSTIGGGAFSGKITGGDDYAIVGSGTNLSPSGLKNSFPYVVGAILFKFTNVGTVSLSKISNLSFTYGSGPAGFIAGLPPAPAVQSAVVPEPSTLLGGLIGGALMFGAALRARSRPFRAS